MKFSRLAPMVVGALLLTSCAALSPSDDDARPAVLASFYPLEYVAARVAGEHATVTSLAAPGAEPHDLELTIRQTADIADADLLVVSSGFQPAVDDAVREVAEAEVVDASEVVELRPLGEHDAHDSHEEGHDDAEGEAVDPHFWLDPTRLATLAQEVEDRLATLDPDHAAAYADNLAALVRDLEELDAEIATGLRGCARDTVVTSHDAFGYFAARYGLEMIAVNGISPDAEPSPARLRELAELIEDEGVTTVFSETLASPRMAQTLSGELGLQTAVLDPLEGLADSTAGEDYLSLMRKNLAALQQANGCR